MRIFKSIFLFCRISLLLCACSSDAIVDTDGESSGVADNTFITIYFNIPGDMAAETRAVPKDKDAITRAGTDEYPGTTGESSVSTVNLYLVEATRQSEGTYTYGNIAAVVKEITPSDVTTTTGNRTYTFTTTVSLPAGYYRLFLIANPNNANSEMNRLNTGTDFDTFASTLRSCASYDQLEAQLFTTGRFLMTNAYDAGQSDIIECQPGGTASATLHMQRAAARIDYIYNEEKKNSNIYPIQVTFYDDNNNPKKYVNVKLTQAALCNVSNSFYYFKHLSADGTSGNATIDASATESNFVIDTDWSSKTIGLFPLTATTLFPLTATATIDKNEFTWKDLPTSNTNETVYADDANLKGTCLFYTSENTVPTGQQLQGICTGVLLKGEFGANEPLFNGITDIFVHNFLIYPANDTKALGALSSVLSAESGKTITIAADKTYDADFRKEHDLLRFTRDGENKSFVTYYPVFIRHRDNNDNTLCGPMEYSVVRNTLYRLRVNSISGFGPNPDPEKPVEEPSHINVQVTTVDWVSREKEYDI